ncbi:MAG: ATP-binding protein [Gloeotrichia echinulata GP01]
MSIPEGGELEGEVFSLEMEISPNEEAVEELAWTLEASAGQFKLILARCNYLRLRSGLVKRVQQLTNTEIEILNLQRNDTTLYAKIDAKVKDKQPGALMVFHLESVRELEQMLSAANQVREEFRKNFDFPVVIWVTDDVLRQMVRLASDFESWATITEFVIPTHELISSLEEDTNTLFATALTSETYSISWQMGYLRRQEIITRLKDLQVRGEELEPALKASVEFVIGQDAYLNNQVDVALTHYQQSWQFWHDLDNESIEEEQKWGESCPFVPFPPYPQSPTTIPHSTLHSPKLRAGILLFYIGLCYVQLAEREYLGYQGKHVQSHNHLQIAANYFQQCFTTFTEANYPILAAKFINPLGEVLQQLKAWDELQKLAHKSLSLQQLYGNPLQVAQAYGYLAEVAASQGSWKQAKEHAYTALHNIAKNKINQQQYRALYLLLLAQAEQNLGQVERAVIHLQMARDIGSEDNPHQYIRILQALRSLYWEQQRYLDAFRAKLEQRSIEQQYGFRAFIGAGRIQPQRQAKLALTQMVQTRLIPSLQEETIAPEITASGRGRDVEYLLERIARPDYKLIVIHGHSGVGKSSLVQAGLLPALKNITIGAQDILPISMGVYTNWVRELGKLLEKALKERGITIEIGEKEGNFAFPPFTSPSLDSPAAILEILRQNEYRNLRTVLIFDQFEEFFFVDPSPRKRRLFFEFLGECLNILGVKVILSLREDYLHYLLECNRLPSMNIINNDILSKNVLYQLGNFAPSDAKSLIERLTQHSNFHLEPALIEKLVQDLAVQFEEVRPIELQVVGAQLQTETITTLANYHESGPKEELVKRYLKEVVEDCGAENKQKAELILYLLTDEKGTRPLKTRSELERELQLLADFSVESYNLDLVLRIFVESGIVVFLPENPDDRYQLVHDYLAAFIQKQQKPKLNELIAELKIERTQRKLSEEKLNLIYRRALYATIAAVSGLIILAIATLQFVSTK